MLYILLKTTNTTTMIGISNLKDNIEKAKISKLGKMSRIFLMTCIQKYTIIVDKGGRYEDHVYHIFRYCFLRKN